MKIHFQYNPWWKKTRKTWVSQTGSFKKDVIKCALLLHQPLDSGYACIFDAAT
jgi:hypothetical protein